MKYFLFFALVIANLSSRAQADSACIQNPSAEMALLESTVTLQGSIVLNPMFGSIEDMKLATEEQKSFKFMLQPKKELLLEQWTSKKNSVLACEVTMVTLSLTLDEQEKIIKAISDSALSIFMPVVSVTGKIRWSESSLEVAGNGVLVDITDVTIY